MLSKEEIEKFIQEMTEVRPDKLNKEGLRLYNIIMKILDKNEQLETENKNLKNILNAGVNKEKQYCFNEDGNTGRCLGYSNIFDDEPCEYCKSCEKINIKEDD